MLRRSFLSAMGLGAPSALLIGGSTLGWSNTVATRAPRDQIRVGTLDLSELPIIDVHMHPPAEVTHSEASEQWIPNFVDALMPDEEYPGKAAHRDRVTERFRRHYYSNPKEVGLRNYVASIYGVEPTTSGIDSVAARHIGKNFTAYIRSVMERENITGILLQSSDSDPVRPHSLIPTESFRWSYSTNPFMDPRWAEEHGFTRLDDVVAGVHKILEQCVSNGCVGFKTSMAYFRPLQFDKVSVSEATRDFDHLRSAKAIPNLRGITYENERSRRALKSYQDYLFKSICVKAGEIGAKVIIHSAVALHPLLRSDYNNPTHLYHLFQDDNVRRAETEFVLIHSGYPHHHHVASMLSQFPNLYVDMSFYPSCPGTLEEVLRAFLALAPSEKIMHGTDWSDPEVWGYSAFNLRCALAKVLNDYRSTYGWSQHLCESMARNVTSENAKRVYGF